MRLPIAQRAGRVVGLVAVTAMLALVLGGTAADPAAVRSSAAAVAQEAHRFIDWCLAHWACPQPVDYGPTAPCTLSLLEVTPGSIILRVR